jgi:rod shape-determining protein MreD
MMRALRFLAALYLAVVLQTLLAPAIEVFGVRPDFPMLLVLLVALKEGPAGGALTGFLAGLFVDVNSAQTLGVTSLANSLLAFGVGSVSDRLVRESIWTRVVVALGATVLRDQIVVVLSGADGINVALRLFFYRSIPGGIYTAVFAPLVMSVGERVIRWRKEPSRAYR